MAQKRYFEFNSRVLSKDSAEACAMASGGIGAIYGFDKASVDTGRNIIKLSSSKKGLYLSDKQYAKQIISNVVITPDGIITTIDGDAEIKVDGLTTGEYLIYATHTYIESQETASVTSFGAVKGTGLVTALTPTTATIEQWYSKIKSLEDGFNESLSVIVALVNYKGDSDSDVYVPYNNQWPLDYDVLNKKIGDNYQTLEKKINDNKKEVDNEIAYIKKKRTFTNISSTNKVITFSEEIKSVISSSNTLTLFGTLKITGSSVNKEYLLYGCGAVGSKVVPMITQKLSEVESSTDLSSVFKTFNLSFTTTNITISFTTEIGSPLNAEIIGAVLNVNN